jgi:FkbM family methyltransferase
MHELGLSLRRAAFGLIPPYNNLIYSICQRYVDRYHNRTDSRMERNGEIYFLQKIAPQLTRDFDVGANVGKWTTHILQFNPDVEVHCFEPSKITFECLQSNNFPANVTLNNLGVSASAGSSVLHVAHALAGVNSLYASDLTTATETVELTTLDSYCQQHAIAQLDLLKIDVEGYEFQVLEGSNEMLSEGKISIIQVEYNDRFIYARVFLKDIFDYLKPLGYHAYKLMPDHLREYIEYSTSLDNFQFSNWVFSLKPLQI